VLAPGISGEIALKKERRIFSLLLKQAVIGNSFKIKNTFFPDNYDQSFSTSGINQLFVSLNYGQELNRSSRFLFKTKWVPYWMGGLGIGFNESRKYYQEQYNYYTYTWESDDRITTYETFVSKMGLGFFVTPRVGLNLYSAKKKKQILNLNFFYDIGVSKQAGFYVKYKIGTYDASGNLNQSKEGTTYLITRGRSYGISISTPLISFKKK
jgi:hypothetical protein